MTRFFLSSHGHLASGLKSSIDILLGSSSRLTVFDAYVDEDSLEARLDGFYRELDPDDQVVLMSDMYGGSVNSVMYTFLDRPNTTLIAGVNLALVIGLLVNEETLSRESIEEVIRQSREALRVVELDAGEEGEEELF